MLYLDETHVNATEGYRLGESGVHATDFNTPGEAFRACRREHGRCTGRVYIDGDNREPIAVGWTFEKKSRYEDTGEPFKQETWITLHAGPPITRHQYLTLSGD